MDVENQAVNGDSPPEKDITPENDGGVLKRIIKEGKGWEKPNSGDRVDVHYVGTLTNGEMFDSSRERDDKFTFTVGKGEVIKGWDIAVKTMKRGELAHFTLRSEYAYGATGSPPKIPPNATLVFEIELFDWRLEDLTKKKDEGVRKTILVDGTGYVSPNEGSTVEIHCITKLGEKVLEERDVTFIVGEGSEEKIVEGIELAVVKMKKSEKALVFCNREYAWGDSPPAELNLPTDYDQVNFEVELKSFEKRKETWEMDSAERLEAAELAKNKGTGYFKLGKYALALKQYQLIPQYIGPPDNSDFDDNVKKDSLLLAAYLNLAMTDLKMNKYLDAISNCDLALELDTGNEKGLFRRGQAYLAIKEFDQAKTDFDTVLKKDPNNTAAKNQIASCNAALRAHKEKEKQTYRNMFQKFAQHDDEMQRRAEKDVWKELKDEEKRDFKSQKNSE
ncbi:Peptidyl-prolyl cis-trans isomerase FKBP4 [Halotydeus destructor]|nr:Peptidyl-prolyl cis-trans isomerase FKBP4 [Halotydeus destructor]